MIYLEYLLARRIPLQETPLRTGEIQTFLLSDSPRVLLPGQKFYAYIESPKLIALSQVPLQKMVGKAKIEFTQAGAEMVSSEAINELFLRRPAFAGLIVLRWRE